MVGRFVSRVRSCKVGVTAFLVALIVGVASVASAQAPITIPVNIPEFDYAAVATTLLGLMATAIAAAIGIGLSFFGIRWLYKTFKGMAK
jgi:hypothetical protein